MNQCATVFRIVGYGRLTIWWLGHVVRGRVIIYWRWALTKYGDMRLRWMRGAGWMAGGWLNVSVWRCTVSVEHGGVTARAYEAPERMEHSTGAWADERLYPECVSVSEDRKAGDTSHSASLTMTVAQIAVATLQNWSMTAVFPTTI